MKVNLKKLVFGAMMTALCVVIGLVCKTYLTFGAIRITFENLPVRDYPLILTFGEFFAAEEEGE